MKSFDLKPLMVFHEATDFTGKPDVVIEEIFADGKGPHSVMCRAVGGNVADLEPFQLEVSTLLDPKKWTFKPELTVGAMWAKIHYLQEYVRKLKKPPPVPDNTYPTCQTCLKVLEDCGCDGLQPLKYGYGEAEPHFYVETTPYKGCGTCGVGPGALHHNSHEVRRYLEEKNTPDLKLNPDGSIAQVDGKAEIERRVLEQLEKGLDRAQTKASLEKTRRMRLMGRVDELKAALADTKRGFELELPGQWPERFNVLLEPEKLEPAEWEQRYDFKARATSPLSWPKGEDIVKVVPLPEDPYAELSSVLWFLASLTSDHDPGCIVKDGKGEPCNCDVTLREGDPWRARVRSSLSLPGALKARLDKAETMLKARRVLQVQPLGGVPGPNGDGTLYEFKMPVEGIQHLLVLKHDPRTLNHEQMRAISDGIRKKIPGVLVLFTQPNWELTLLELP